MGLRASQWGGEWVESLSMNRFQKADTITNTDNNDGGFACAIWWCTRSRQQDQQSINQDKPDLPPHNALNEQPQPEAETAHKRRSAQCKCRGCKQPTVRSATDITYGAGKYSKCRGCKQPTVRSATDIAYGAGKYSSGSEKTKSPSFSASSRRSPLFVALIACIERVW